MDIVDKDFIPQLVMRNVKVVRKEDGEKEGSASGGQLVLPWISKQWAQQRISRLAVFHFGVCSQTIQNIYTFG